MKVYCENCVHLKGRHGAQENMRCEHPSNIIVKHTWFSARQDYNTLPVDINSNNDCEWYIEMNLK